ncbi:MAG: hypothetical protein HRF50_15770 [Phycisphaerae bacterium]|jgi:hypothetical protein
MQAIYENVQTVALPTTALTQPRARAPTEPRNVESTAKAAREPPLADALDPTHAVLKLVRQSVAAYNEILAAQSESGNESQAAQELGGRVDQYA